MVIHNKNWLYCSDQVSQYVKCRYVLKLIFITSFRAGELMSACGRTRLHCTYSETWSLVNTATYLSWERARVWGYVQLCTIFGYMSVLQLSDTKNFAVRWLLRLFWVQNVTTVHCFCPGMVTKFWFTSRLHAWRWVSTGGFNPPGNRVKELAGEKAAYRLYDPCPHERHGPESCGDPRTNRFSMWWPHIFGRRCSEYDKTK